MLICQSCGMNIEDDKFKGTNIDDSLSLEFCSFCFTKGKFNNNFSLDEQVDIGLEYSPEYKSANTQEEKDIIRQQAKEYLSTLKRWHCTCTEKCASGYNPECTCTSSECHCTDKPNS